MKKALATKTDDKLKAFCIEKAIQFLHSKEHLQMMSEWLTLDKEIKLDPNQKYTVLKTYFASPDFSTD